MNNIFNTLDDNYILYGKQKITVIIDDNDDIWFNAKQTAKSLGYKDTKYTIRHQVSKKDLTQLKYINITHHVPGHPQSLYLSESGLYKLIFKSRMKEAKVFTEWVTGEVLPSIRKYGSYRLKIQYEKERKKLLQQINLLRDQQKTMKSDMRKEKFPHGALVYVVDYSTANEEIYRIGKTNNMTLRKRVYDTHTLHKHEVVFTVECKFPSRLESCLRYMLSDFKYKRNKDFYVCSLTKIKKAIRKCIRDFDYIDKQIGGSKTNSKKKSKFELYLIREIRRLNAYKQKIEKKIRKLTKYLEDN